jgi:hypothetical protein
MDTLAKDAVLTILLCSCFINTQAQSDSYNNDSLNFFSGKWHIKNGAYISSYNIQSVPGSMDSLFVSIYIKKDYYRVPGIFLDSLSLRNRFITDTDKGMKKILKKYLIFIPQIQTNHH